MLQELPISARECGIPGFYITKDAKVFKKDKNGYKPVSVKEDKKQIGKFYNSNTKKYYSLIQAYAEAFVPNTNKKPLAFIKNIDKGLNPDNIMWATTDEWLEFWKENTPRFCKCCGKQIGADMIGKLCKACFTKMSNAKPDDDETRMFQERIAATGFNPDNHRFSGRQRDALELFCSGESLTAIASVLGCDLKTASACIKSAKAARLLERMSEDDVTPIGYKTAEDVLNENRAIEVMPDAEDESEVKPVASIVIEAERKAAPAPAPEPEAELAPEPEAAPEPELVQESASEPSVEQEPESESSVEQEPELASEPVTSTSRKFSDVEIALLSSYYFESRYFESISKAEDAPSVEAEKSESTEQRYDSQSHSHSLTVCPETVSHSCEEDCKAEQTVNTDAPKQEVTELTEVSVKSESPACDEMLEKSELQEQVVESKLSRLFSRFKQLFVKAEEPESISDEEYQRRVVSQFADTEVTYSTEAKSETEVVSDPVHELSEDLKRNKENTVLSNTEYRSEMDYLFALYKADGTNVAFSSFCKVYWLASKYTEDHAQVLTRITTHYMCKHNMTFNVQNVHSVLLTGLEVLSSEWYDSCSTGCGNSIVGDTTN